MNNSEPHALQGRQLIVSALLLALANFIVVLDMTIANVSIPHIAGGLAISFNEGTYVISSYAVAEALTVPLTGWLANRFGMLRVFTVCMLLFGVCSFLCGLSQNLGMLLTGRVLQGLVGGPLMPLSQTLLMRIFPKEKQGAALGLWGMTTLVAPILGPIAGGYICDNWGWTFIFFINIPIALVCSLTILRLMRQFETPTSADKIDYVGLGLMVVCVTCIQLMLDEGKRYDWFESIEVWTLLILGLISFACFMIWELTQEHPIIDLRIFRHRGYAASVFAISLAFAAFFGSVVLTPLWLQGTMGYTATASGITVAAMGILAVFAAPFAGQFSQTYDPRMLAFLGVAWLGAITFLRSFSSTEMSQFQIMLPLLAQGVGIPFFFIPLTSLALASVEPREMASAAGLMNFVRTLSGAAATSVVVTVWENQTTAYRTDLVGQMASPFQLASIFGDVSEAGQTAATHVLDALLQSQAVMLAMNHIFLVSSGAFMLAAACIWIAAKPTPRT
ncbi:MAG: DHA2 family efflux MFS transporter permease subunit [Alphaproteobacteria bacterium]